MSTLESAIFMYNHYTAHTKKCWQYYNLVDAYFLFDYYMQMAAIYEEAILSQI